MTYEEAEALIREHMDYGGNVKVHALATTLSEARRTVSADAEKDAEPARKKLCTGSHVTCEGREYCLGHPSCDDLLAILAAKEKK